MNDSNPKCLLTPNKHHKKGDRLPCLKTIEPIEISEPGLYEVAIWAPKANKKAYFMLLKKSENNDQQTELEPEQPWEGSKYTTPIRPIFNDSPFK